MSAVTMGRVSVDNEVIAGQFDEISRKLASLNVSDAMDSLHSSLRLLRGRLAPVEWKAFCHSQCHVHPIKEALHQDPFTRRSFMKPRGYSGDAVLIDYLYGNATPGPAVSDLGADICRYMCRQPSAYSVQDRRDLLAAMVDETAAAAPHPRILSIACGHLREAKHSRAVSEGRVAEYVAVDQDPESLARVTEELPYRWIKPAACSVRSILSGKVIFSDFDFVYAAGLYDYLTQAVATRLTRVMFGMLRSGGRMLVANFAQSQPECGYMEAFMDWWLIRRDEPEMSALGEEIPAVEVSSRRLFRDVQENVVYLEITKC